MAVQADTTSRLTEDGLITLRKSCGPDAQEGEIAGRKSFWIRARISDRRPLARITGVNGTRLSVEEARDFLPGDEVTIDSREFARIVLTGAGLLPSMLPFPPPWREGGYGSRTSCRRCVPRAAISPEFCPGSM